MLYPGKLHSIVSESEGGKTWLALCICAHEIRNGRHVVYIDFEDDEGGIVGRLIAMQVSPEQIARFFHYHRPTEALKAGPPWEALESSLKTSPTVAVIDGITEAMTLHGLNPNDNAEIARFGHILPKALQSYGAAALCLDHVVKDREGRGRYALGGVHKLNGIDGASYILENRHPIGDNLVGRSYLRIAKDRPGQLRKHAVVGKPMYWFADLVVDLTLDGQAEGVVTVEPAIDRKETDQRPTMVMMRVCNELTKHPDGLPQRVIQTVVQGGTQTIRQALSHLISGGYVTAKSPHKLIKPFFDGGESDDDDE